MQQSPTDIVAALERDLQRLKQGAVRPQEPARRRRGWVTILLIVLLATVPLLTLVRLGVFFYDRFDLPAWVAIALAALVTVLLLSMLAASILARLTGRAGFAIILKWVAAPLIAVYCGYALLYVADANTKTPEVRSFYGTLHPLMRVALATFVLADDDLVVTDIARSPSDYRAMGLPTARSSDHYPQQEGYVHAMDLRTRERSGLRNGVLEAYFRVMGFRTLRHVGTADHLHVSLPQRR